MKKHIKMTGIACSILAGIYLAARAAAKKKNEEEQGLLDADNRNKTADSSSGGSIDGNNIWANRDGGRRGVDDSRSAGGVYRKTVKPAIDRTLSFGGLVLLWPLFAAVSAAVWIDDPGPVFFAQKRIGKDKTYFLCHKFRTMKMSAPHDVPTHQLKNPEQYITRVGKFLRKTSLDEIPQIWDIFRARMSVIGPRPALWNQDDLVAERDKYGANDILPGLTGWAQIRGRDELEIPDKARLDGEYTKILRQGGMRAFLQDVRCFGGTVGSVLKTDGVVEGGTGAIRRIEVPTVEEASFEDYGYLKHFYIDKERKIRVLITGAGSYVGESFRAYCEEHFPNIACSTVDMIDRGWRKQDFSGYDSVFHVAGIAHADVGKVSEEELENYYKVNTDLAIACCRKAKMDGVKQFVFMSSMIIYGGREYIDEGTVPAPDNFYGNSKWLADKGVRELADETYHVAVLRPPMIYGRGSKGNYQTLAKLARKLPVFPDVENKRSMLYIENFCEFAALLMLSGEGGIYFPQNKEFTETSELVQEIGRVAGRSVKVTKLLSPAVMLASHVPGKISDLANKAFGSRWYDQKLSQYTNFNYQKTGFIKSIAQAEQIPKPKESRLITVITVCYNSAEVIEKTIQSVLHQTYDHVEYLIIDGASTDETIFIARKYETAFKARGYGFTIISEPDNGIYDAMNKGIKLASGELIGFINAGDWYEKDAVETVAGEYEAETFDYFYADINIVRSDGVVIVKHSKRDHFITSRHWNHPSSFCAKKLYEKIGTFRCEGIHDDFEFFLRVRKNNSQIKIVNKVLANFVTGGISNEKGTGKNIQRIKDRYECYRKNEYSPLYLIECVGIETVKFLIG